MKIKLETGTIPIKAGGSKLRFLFAGDFVPCGNVAKKILAGKTKEVISGTGAFLMNKDLSIVNLEAPMTESEDAILKTGPNLKVKPGTEQFLLDAGFDIIGLANNHMKDFGPQPVLETKAILEGRELKTVGAGANREDSRKPLIIEKNGLKIAVMAIAENEFGNADEITAGAAPMDPIKDIAQIKELSAACDITIMFIHGGTEYLPVPGPRVTELYRAYIDAGASAVVGMHTHCPQGIEIYNGCPILYSLGNFFFPTVHDKQYSQDDFWWKSFIASIEFDAAGQALSIDILPHSIGPDETEINAFADKEKKDFFGYLQFISDLILNETEQKKIWNAWCAKMGPLFIKFFQKAAFPVVAGDNDDYKNMLILRNLYACESHNDLNTTFFKLIEKGKIEDALKYCVNIEKMQKGEVYEIE